MTIPSRPGNPQVGAHLTGQINSEGTPRTPLRGPAALRAHICARQGPLRRVLIPQKLALNFLYGNPR